MSKYKILSGLYVLASICFIGGTIDHIVVGKQVMTPILLTVVCMAIWNYKKK
ncbi:hypothetical protein [Floccifex sp.]|uniref:hypothetical protein n=1 Tax=Floccifex sp. TaxID=2815810 RepID=UPI002A759B8C|nr:hypothetical protein [Floccifex sp.]MDD7280912.1 hypothetical protein [Erysipelotrichaceae bacterium]MDY2958583.1 hypothetical protein [Floccifex sp.]